MRIWKKQAPFWFSSPTFFFLNGLCSGQLHLSHILKDWHALKELPTVLHEYRHLNWFCCGSMIPPELLKTHFYCCCFCCVKNLQTLLTVMQSLQSCNHAFFFHTFCKQILKAENKISLFLRISLITFVSVHILNTSARVQRGATAAVFISCYFTDHMNGWGECEG